MKHAIRLADLVSLLIKGEKVKQLLEFVKNQIPVEVDVNLVQNKLRLITLKFQKLWQEAGRKRERFLETNQMWIRGEFVVDVISSPKRMVGRPSKPFEEMKTKSKKLRVESILSQYSSQEILFAAAISITRAGFRKAGKLIEKIAEKPETAMELQRLADRSEEAHAVLNAEEALAFLCKNEFSKAQYTNIRQTTISKGVDIFPAYNKLVEAKKLCYPTGISINSSAAEVPLQELVEHTTKRLFEGVKCKETHQNFLSFNNYTLIYKWGCDGSSNHARYKQGFFEENENGEMKEYSDSHIFAFSLVPLRLIGHRETVHDIVWNNDLPSSISLCRPIKLIFAKETAELTKQEVSLMNLQIQNLEDIEFTVDGRSVVVKPEMLFTMMDTKVVNDITGTHSQACYVCGRSGRCLNNPRADPDSDDPAKYQFGFSPLHVYIRTMEMLLKVSYRMILEKPTWRVSKSNEAVKARESEIRDMMRKELGLRISEPVPGGGNSNDGNTARKFFREWKMTAKITGLNEELLERFNILLTVINCKSEIDYKSFEIYAEQTRALYEQFYGWYTLSPTVHKLLVHGAAIVKYTVLPVGMCSEEAQETRNKSIRKYREFHSRKFSRTVNIEDVFKRLLLSSDPAITMRNRICSKIIDLELPAAANLLVNRI